MVKIKLLEIIENDEPIGVNIIEKFIQGLKNVLGTSIETVNKMDPNFDGYYLLPMGFNFPDDGNGIVGQDINERVFLLAVADIGRMLEECKPAGLTRLTLFMNASTAIVGKAEIIESVKTLEDRSNIMYEEFGYDYYVPIPYDDTYETVAKAILSYLELYDKWLKNK